MPAGRPTDYNQKYCNQIIEYFKKPPFHTEYKREYFNNGEIKSETPILIANEFPTFQGFADEIGVHFDTLREWVKVHKEFSESYAHAKALQEKIWLINGLQNLYNSQFAQFFGKNCLGYKDQQEITVNDQQMSDEEIKSRVKQLLEKMDDSPNT